MSSSFTKNLFHNSSFNVIRNIIFENENFVAVNKPSGLLTIPDRHNDTINSLYKILQQQYNQIFIVHRLDRETSGLIVFAKNETTHKFLSRLFEQRNIDKYYLAIIRGVLQNKKGIIEEPIIEHPVKKGLMIVDEKGKPSVTEYEVQEEYGIYSLVKFKINTGRTHQIRVHMKHIGHPVVCDELYGDPKPVLLSSFKKKFKLGKQEEEEKPLLSRLALHSYQLHFKDEQGKIMDLIAELPKDMKAVLQQLQKNRK